MDNKQEDFATQNVAEILNLWGPTIVHLIERQARNDFMFTMLEKNGVLPKGSNALGDALMEKLKGENEKTAIKTAAANSEVIPFEYVQKVGVVRRTLEENERVINNICEGLGIPTGG